ncbi:MAG TPA: hypothetical protein VHN79_03640 [Lacunisphaera sp.]|nr:hypothetical protein [Lacunisphaera sp.]
MALRHIEAPQTSEREREAILSTVAETFSGPIGETASRSLFHLREGRKLQLTLKNIMEGAK